MKQSFVSDYENNKSIPNVDIIKKVQLFLMYQQITFSIFHLKIKIS
ncbi:hypothetical protein [Enterococcus hirae]